MVLLESMVLWGRVSERARVLVTVAKVAEPKGGSENEKRGIRYRDRVNSIKMIVVRDTSFMSFVQFII